VRKSGRDARAPTARAALRCPAGARASGPLPSDTIVKTAGESSRSAAANRGAIRAERFVRVQDPLLATQQQIVAEIEAEQALVATNRDLIARFEKKIQATLARVWGTDAEDAELDDAPNVVEGAIF